ncbi:MAG: ATPase [Gammaproteobacteria bacterium]|nr:ATPase [Gammaproteobacteria bacterium]
MSFRPQSTQWFEILVPVSNSTHIISHLAQTGAVEIEMRPHHNDLMHLQELSDDMSEYHELFSRYGRYWERGLLNYTSFTLTPKKVLKSALVHIAKWSQKADPIISEIQSLEEERSHLLLCQHMFTQLQESPTDFSKLLEAGPVLTSKIIVRPMTEKISFNTAMLMFETEIDDQLAQFVIFPVNELKHWEHTLRDINGRLISLPDWLHGNFCDALIQLTERLEQLDEKLIQRYMQLDVLYDAHNLSNTLGDVVSLEWCIRHVGSLEPASGLFVWITGWTTKTKAQLQKNLFENDFPALIHFPPSPSGVSIPQVLHNSRWSKPFEIFTRALGMPSSTEVDPSSLLILIVPLLFGYMFADVGQGFVLMVTGLYLKKRWKFAPLLMLCGVSAILFGFLFGSVFSREDLLPALWFHPLNEPLTVLLVPVLFALFLLAFGQLLNGLEAVWRRKISIWLRVDAGFLLFYFGLALSLWTGQLHELILFGFFWYLCGKFSLKPNLLGIFGAIGSLLENAMSILVNTISFSRVGAFCLAHAGLSSALVTLADVTNNPLIGLLVMLIGNILILFLEGLVVSIQTTRLVLFEFFNRFLQGQGRVFRPMPLPPMSLKRRSS